MRYKGLDVLRGIALINMIVYHALWDVVDIFNVRIPWFHSSFGRIWQQCICCTFILLSGFCFKLGKHKLKRGITVFLCSVIISAVTAILIPDNIILFGVLTLLGSAMLIMIPVDKIFEKVNPYIGITLAIALFVLTKNVANGSLPEMWYANNITAFIGFPPKWFVSRDYFPLIPWLFLYVAGYFLYDVLKKNNCLMWLNLLHCKPLEWAGRRSLFIYMIHQPILYGLIFAIHKLI